MEGGDPVQALTSSGKSKQTQKVENKQSVVRPDIVAANRCYAVIVGERQ